MPSPAPKVPPLAPPPVYGNLSGSPAKKSGGKTLLLILLGLLGACCLLTAIAAGIFWWKRPAFLSAGLVDQARQTAAIVQLRTIGTSLEAYRATKGAYPPVNIGEGGGYGIGEISALELHLVPEFIATLPEKDPWGNPLLYGSTLDGNSCAVLCTGSDGSQEAESIPDTATPTTCFEADIIWSNGQLIQYPEGEQSKCNK